MRIKPATDEVQPEEFEPEDIDLDEEADPILSTVLIREGIADLANSPELRRVINGAMSGELPLDSPLEVNQPQKLSPRAIQAILLCVGNYYTKKEIAEITGLNYVYYTKLVRHPYARRILTIANAAAIGQLSSIDRRLKRKSPKMLKIVQEIAEDDQADAPTRLRAAFGWLDRAGHSVTQKSEVRKNVNKSVTVTHKRSKLLAEAIREASEVVEAEFEVEDDSEAEAAEELSPVEARRAS